MIIGLENLRIYQESRKLEIEVYKITEKFPKEERYAKRSQMRRSSSSVADNIAEGYGKFNYLEKIHSLNKGGSLCNRYTEFIKGINVYIKYLKRRRAQNLE